MEWLTKTISQKAQDTWKNLENVMTIMTQPPELNQAPDSEIDLPRTEEEEIEFQETQEEISQVLIPTSLKEYVESLCNKTTNFTEFLLKDSGNSDQHQNLKKESFLDDFESLNDTENIKKPQTNHFLLTPKQEHHALMMLKLVPKLSDLRFKLVPDVMTEDQFWKIYFALIRKKVGRTLDHFPPNPNRNERLYRRTQMSNLEKIQEREIESETFWNKYLKQPQNHIETLKDETLKGIPDFYRKKVWKIFLSFPNSNFSDEFEKYAEKFENNTLQDLQQSFHESFSFNDHYLSAQGVNSVKKILFFLSDYGTDISLASQPIIADITCILTYFLTEKETFMCIKSIEKLPKFQKFVEFDMTLYSPALLMILEKETPNLYNHLKALEIESLFAEKWFVRFFIRALPFQTVLRIFDWYCLEGTAILFKVCLAILQLSSPLIFECQTYESFFEILDQKMKEWHDADLLLFTAESKSSVTDQRILKALCDARALTTPYYEGFSTIVSRDQFSAIWSWLPSAMKLKEPKKLFCSSVDGFNINTLMEKCIFECPTILLIKTNSQNIFGAFVTAPWEASHKYKGTGEMFVFSIIPKAKKYPWTKLNECFFTIQEKTLVIGGGDGCAIWLDDELDRGISEKSSTFNNEPLNGENKDFSCVELEVFGFK